MKILNSKYFKKCLGPKIGNLVNLRNTSPPPQWRLDCSSTEHTPSFSSLLATFLTLFVVFSVHRLEKWRSVASQRVRNKSKSCMVINAAHALIMMTTFTVKEEKVCVHFTHAQD